MFFNELSKSHTAFEETVECFRRENLKCIPKFWEKPFLTFSRGDTSYNSNLQQWSYCQSIPLFTLFLIMCLMMSSILKTYIFLSCQQRHCILTSNRSLKMIEVLKLPQKWCFQILMNIFEKPNNPDIQPDR